MGSVWISPINNCFSNTIDCSPQDFICSHIRVCVYSYLKALNVLSWELQSKQLQKEMPTLIVSLTTYAL